MAPVTFTDTETWYAGLPTMYGAAAALIAGPSGRVLLVKPNYRDHWSLPGGILEHGEPPHVGCAREVAEEVGLQITVGPLLVIDWAPPDQQRPRPFVSFVFDGGEVSPGTDIRLQTEELDDYRFASPDELGSYLPPFMQARYKAAMPPAPPAPPSTYPSAPTEGARWTTSSKGRRLGCLIGVSGRSAG